MKNQQTIYNFNLNLSGHDIKYLLRLCLRETERIDNKYYEYYPTKRADLNRINNIINQLSKKIIEIQNELGVKI